MVNRVCKTIALVLALLLICGVVAFAEKETASGAFKLPGVSVKEQAAAPAIDVSKLKVEIQSSMGDVIIPGETIVLTSLLTGFEGLSYSLQWQCSDGNGWKDVEGATGESYSYIVDDANINLQWRLAVTL